MSESAEVVYEIVNPSDAYTMVSASPAAAAAACMVLGSGYYALKAPDGSSACPIFLGGGALEWFRETHGADLNEFLTSQRLAIADALDSVQIGRERVTTDDRKRHHDEHRSSMNDIGRRAWALAKAMRATQAEAESRAEPASA